MATPYRKTLWPKRVTRLPKYIREGLDNLTQNKIITAGIKKIPASSIIAGDYSHLGITISGGNLSINPSIVPPDDMGKMSRANIHGYFRKRYDLPKVPKTFTLTGKDWRGNEIDNDYSRDVYLVENYPALGLEISVNLIHEEFGDEAEYFIRFDVTRELDKSDNDFDRKILENLGFLRENTGLMGIFPTRTSDSTMSMMTFTHWEFLPPGISLSDLLKRTIGNSKVKDEDRRELEARLKLLHELKPGGGFVAGTKGLSGYIAACFGDSLTVLENRHLGNAIYVIYKDWSTFSKMSRTEIRNSGRDSDFERIMHVGDWVDRLQKLVQSKRSDL